jgi:hypothetical protein
MTSARNESMEGLLSRLSFVYLSDKAFLSKGNQFLILIRRFDVLKMIYDVAMWRNAA